MGTVFFVEGQFFELGFKGSQEEPVGVVGVAGLKKEEPVGVVGLKKGQKEPVGVVGLKGSQQEPV